MQAGSLRVFLLSTCTIVHTRAVNPDPHGFVFIFPPGPGSRRVKFKNNYRKNARKLVIIVILIEKIKVNLDQLHGVLL